jgi:hypothetical protein
MTLGHVQALARTIQGRLGGCFYEYVDRAKSDSAHQRGVVPPGVKAALIQQLLRTG